MKRKKHQMRLARNRSWILSKTILILHCKNCPQIGTYNNMTNAMTLPTDECRPEALAGRLRWSLR